jgi:hypothetical protein
MEQDISKEISLLYNENARSQDVISKNIVTDRSSISK